MLGIIKGIKTRTTKTNIMSQDQCICLPWILLAVLILPFQIWCSRTSKSEEKGSKDSKRYEMPSIWKTNKWQYSDKDIKNPDVFIQRKGWKIGIFLDVKYVRNWGAQKMCIGKDHLLHIPMQV